MSLRALTLCVWCAGIFRPGSPSARYTSFQSGVQWRWRGISIPFVAGKEMRSRCVVRFPSHQTFEERKCITSLYIYTSYWDLYMYVRTLFWLLSLSILHAFVSWVSVCALKINHSHCGWKKLPFSVCHWSVHVTSHIRDMRCIWVDWTVLASQGKVP
jgi:hypothetical protein